MKKALLIIAVACLLSSSFVQIASADWFICTVTQSGPGAGGTFIMLTDNGGTFANRWFLATADRQKEMLATALFAMGNGKTVTVNVTSPAAYSSITSMYVRN